MAAGDWSSLDDEVAVAADLFGSNGIAMVLSWLEFEASRTNDDAFAAQFYENVSLPGVLPSDYLHRLLHTSHGNLLGGIRFRGRDVNRPFVEIIAHGFDDLDRLCACVSDEWSMFAPEYLRICARPGRISGPNVLVDMSIFASRYRDIHAADPAVELMQFSDIGQAIEMVRRRYQRLAVDDPALARNVFPAASSDLERWHLAGQLKAIAVDGEPVGALAIAPGSIRWIEGDEIQEEVIDAAHCGHGYAALAQAAWARCIADDQGRLLIGTIDGRNTASRKTAGRARRRRVLDRLFISV